MFFDAHKELCIPRGVVTANRSKYLLARAVIQRHLSINLSKLHQSLEIHVFPSIYDTSFKNYLQNTGVYFLMCHDGANPSPPPKASKDVTAQINAQETSRKFAFRVMICTLIHEGYNIALINGLEWMDTKVRNVNVHKFFTKLYTGRS